MHVRDMRLLLGRRPWEWKGGRGSPKGYWKGQREGSKGLIKGKGQREGSKGFITATQLLD